MKCLLFALLLLTLVFASCSSSDTKRMMKFTATGVTYIADVDTMYHINDTIYLTTNVKAVVIR